MQKLVMVMLNSYIQLCVVSHEFCHIIRTVSLKVVQLIQVVCITSAVSRVS